ncbi:hypothetical protein AABB24_015844 [Solanum stoloniferum]|uniref:Uncharacterized protein n=1 Tax=Solanum stoloniferum TaxID=62892 RepID=A0ABD2TRC1_9SOLN
MDIDLLWTLGGVLLFFQSNYYCMATFKSQSFLYFITLFLILFILVHSNNHHDQNSDPNYSSSSSSSSSSSTSSTTRATMKLHPRKIPKNQAEYGGAAHEVPSGPNPISNR